MADFEFRTRGHATRIDASHELVKGPWLELDAPSFDEALAAINELSSATGLVYDVRPREAEE